MSQLEFVPSQQRLRSLTVRISLWLVASAIIPLLIALALNEWLSRPALIAQANVAMQSDAATRAQLIDTYLRERLLDAETLTQVPSVQTFLAAPYAPYSPLYQDGALHAGYALAAGTLRDKQYTTWVLFDAQGQPRLYYPLTTLPQKHGQSFASQEYLQAVQSGKTFVSAVYYNPSTKKASVDIYSPIIMQPAALPQPMAETPQASIYLGFMRATLNLDVVWNIVKGDRGNNGPGSYAFILDENGVRIADTETAELFQAVAPLPSTTQQRIVQEARYGSMRPVNVLADQTFAEKLQNTTASAIFQTQPTGKNETYQVVQHTISALPWKYFVLSPINTVTAVANQQLLITMAIMFPISLLVAFVGWIIGRNITYPILSSVNYLHKSKLVLSDLSMRQQDTASDQVWVFDSSQHNLQSAQYYTEAIRVAARYLDKATIRLGNQWSETNIQRTVQSLTSIIEAAQYIENAVGHLDRSNQKLATTLSEAIQIKQQIAEGAISATAAATQLEHVVQKLRSVIGK